MDVNQDRIERLEQAIGDLRDRLRRQAYLLRIAGTSVCAFIFCVLLMASDANKNDDQTFSTVTITKRLVLKDATSERIVLEPDADGLARIRVWDGSHQGSALICAETSPNPGSSTGVYVVGGKGPGGDQPIMRLESTDTFTRILLSDGYAGSVPIGLAASEQHAGLQLSSRNPGLTLKEANEFHFTVDKNVPVFRVVDSSSKTKGLISLEHDLPRVVFQSEGITEKWQSGPESTTINPAADERRLK
jgi:hypothetical protein